MKTLFLYAGALVGAAAVAAWFWRDSPAVRQATQAVGLPGRDSTPSTHEALAAAGVHKCRTASGIVYLDKPCPKGSTELAANGGAVTVMSFPKPAAEPSALASGPLVKGFGKEEIDRLRDKQIEDAANR